MDVQIKELCVRWLLREGFMMRDGEEIQSDIIVNLESDLTLPSILYTELALHPEI